MIDDTLAAHVSGRAFACRLARVPAVACVALALSLVVSVPALRAQTSKMVYAGAGATGGVGIESAEIVVYAGDGECGTFESGSAAFGSIDGRMVLPVFFGPNVGLDARLRVSYGSARLTATPRVATTVRDAEDGQLVTLQREFRLDRSTVATAVDMLARFAAGPLSLGAGVSVGARVSSTFEQTDNILGPGDRAFADGQTSSAMSIGSKNAATFVIAPMLAAGFPIALGERNVLVPELSMRIDLTSSMTEESWRTVELGLGVGVLIDLTPEASPIIPGR